MFDFFWDFYQKRTPCPSVVRIRKKIYVRLIPSKDLEDPGPLGPSSHSGFNFAQHKRAPRLSVEKKLCFLSDCSKDLRRETIACSLIRKQDHSTSAREIRPVVRALARNHPRGVDVTRTRLARLRRAVYGSDERRRCSRRRPGLGHDLPTRRRLGWGGRSGK